MAELRGVFAEETLMRLREASLRCFAAMEAGGAIPESYRYSQTARVLLLTALKDFGIKDEEELIAPWRDARLAELFDEALGEPWACKLEHAWVRKKCAPQRMGAGGWQIQDWHQDGALGAKFAPEPGAATPMRRLLTCWIPLNDCGVDCPGLEFVRARQEALLHFTDLGDEKVRERLGAERFWAPELQIGDGLVFSSDVLHRTYVHAGMEHERLSVDYRIFPR